MKFNQVHVSINHIKFRELWNFPFFGIRDFLDFLKILTLKNGNYHQKWELLLIIFPKIPRFYFFDILITMFNSRLFMFDRFVWIFMNFHESKNRLGINQDSQKSGIINQPTDQKFNSLTTIKMQFEKCQKRQFLVSKSQKLASHH